MNNGMVNTFEGRAKRKESKMNEENNANSNQTDDDELRMKGAPECFVRTEEW